jgi:hypothetical protein
MLTFMRKDSAGVDKSSSKPYNFEDAMKVAEDIFSLHKDNEYHPGAFIHGLIFALEATQQTYKIPPKQLAEVKRGVRRYFIEMNSAMMKETKK